MNDASSTSAKPAVVGAFNYLTATVAPSLHRNGKVFTRRDRDGSDSAWVGAEMVLRDMPVHDARRLSGAARRTLADNGFETVDAPLADPAIDFLDHDVVVRQYYPHCAELVLRLSGARFVAAFDHNVRSAAGKRSKRRIQGGQQVQGPAQIVHGDYTLTSAPQRLRDLARPPTANDTLRTVLGEGVSLLAEVEVERAIASGRFAIINVCRNIAPTPVATRPLALCDANTVRPQDLVVFEIRYADRVGENYFARHHEDHRWYYYPALTRGEALLIKQWDSAGELARSNGARGDTPDGDAPCTFSFHSAFEDPTTSPDAPERWSIEVRCVALYG